ncbi:MAG: tetratricopeptide repeat protein [Saprospiraceae bacterium]|nr:tetratricopeptide repeat protein [Saprospiraceae bacterium]
MSKDKRKQPSRGDWNVMSYSIPNNPLLWASVTCILTAIAYFPMLANGFTNWDDPSYITENPLLLGPDWGGIFSKPVMSNYHPLTVASLALNYQASQLSPFFYHFVDWILHILNTGLVFFLAFKLSNGKHLVGFITALYFGIHPMHVESVAWASERKDVLFTFFFLLSLLYYLRYLERPDWKIYLGVLALFVLSLLSKPAAVTLPIVLLLIDWYRGRELGAKNLWLEKIPFFALALAFGLFTLQIQSENAIAEAGFYPPWQKAIFACYGFGEYIIRLFWPFPLSAIHPFPKPGVIPISFYPALLTSVATVAAAWFFRKNKDIVFGLVFYTVNLVLVLQILTFGNSIISERYTYVPYIGLMFAIATSLEKCTWPKLVKNGVLGLLLIFALGLAMVSNKQVRVWKDSLTLWTKVIESYPDNHIARSNRGNYLANKLNRVEEGLADYNAVLKIKPDHVHSLENRAIIYLQQHKYKAGYADAEQIVRLHPNLPKGYFLRAFAADKLQNPDQAIADYSSCIALQPSHEEASVNRGALYFNFKKDYQKAKDDFDTAIQINPKNSNYYIFRARCWDALQNPAEALEDIATAKQLGNDLNLSSEPRR